MEHTDLRSTVAYADYTELLYNVRAQIARHERVNAQHVILTCGATGGIDLAFGALKLGSTIAMMPYEYFDALKIASGYGHQLVRPITDTNDMQAFINLIKAGRPDAVYLSLPNNPLGTTYTRKDLFALLQALPNNCQCIIDQTLVSTSAIPSRWFAQTAPKKRIMLLRSFSKSHNAVLERVGYAVTFNSTAALHPFTHAPAASSLRKVSGYLKDRKTPKRQLKLIETNNQILRLWSVQQKTVRWDNASTNFGALHLLQNNSKQVTKQLQAQHVQIKNQDDLSCPGNFLRVPLDVSSRTLRHFLKILDTILKQ